MATMCRYPGCVAGAVNGGETCFVHLHGVGKLCAFCRGEGSRFYSGQNATMPCLYCGGTGLKDSSRRPVKPLVVPVEERGLIVAAGEPGAGSDAVTVLEAENTRKRDSVA